MKQLLIVNSAKAIKSGVADDLTVLEQGQIGFFNLKPDTSGANAGKTTFLAAAPKANFGIALGRGANTPAFIIPEVDVNTLQVSVAPNAAGGQFTGTITIPTPAAGKNYTLILVKLGTGINGERNKWTQSVYTPMVGSMTAADLADKLRKGFKAMADADSLEISVSGSGAVVTITGMNYDEWKLMAADDLYGTAVTNTSAFKPVGDKAYVADLARMCAAGKGFTNTDLESQHIYPGYPEAVEDTDYTVFNLRFAVGREAGKQTDERVFQIVHIAVPTSNASLNTIKTILGQPVLVNE